MGLFSRKNKEITVNECINRSRTEPNSVLLDIRGKDDFKESHIAGSINIPLDSIERITSGFRIRKSRFLSSEAMQAHR